MHFPTLKQTETDMRDLVLSAVRDDLASDKLWVGHAGRTGQLTWHEGKVRALTAPLGSGAYARTLRIHQIMAANNCHEPTEWDRRYPPEAVSAVDNAIIQIHKFKDMPVEVNRDRMAVGIMELRSVPEFSKLGSQDHYNQAIHSILMGLAITSNTGLLVHAHHSDMLGPKLSSTSHPSTQAALGRRQRGHYRTMRLINDTKWKLPLPIVQQLSLVISLCANYRRKEAIKAYCGLLRLAPHWDDMQDPAYQKIKQKMKQEEERLEREMRNDLPGDYQDDERQGAHGVMEIVHLPMTDMTNPAAPRTTVARSGPRLNRPRLARMIANKSPVGCFVRQRYLEGGCIVIDASGSMGLDDEALTEICLKAPAATVAYYGGYGYIMSGKWGILKIFAQGGRRASKATIYHRDNDVDYFALQWLLKQPGPRYFVTDGDFCGGPSGQHILCAKLLSEACGTGQVRWVRSVEEMRQLVGLPPTG